MTLRLMVSSKLYFLWMAVIHLGSDFLSGERHTLVLYEHPCHKNREDSLIVFCFLSLQLNWEMLQCPQREMKCCRSFY